VTDTAAGRVVGALTLERVRDLTLASAKAARRPAHVAAASGLVLCDGVFLVVADDELALGAFTAVPGEHGALWPLMPGTLPWRTKERKARKPDWEALVLLGRDLVAVPSGSKPHRTVGAVLPLRGAAPRGPARPVDFAPLYARLADAGFGQLNIEGACVRGEELLLFQRGNGAGARNAIIALDRRAAHVAICCHMPLGGELVRSVRAYDLGELEGVRLGFTDAAVGSDGRIVFVAAAEATDDAYEDAPVTGSVVGFIDASGEITGVRVVAPRMKAEGLAVQDAPEGQVAWLVTDADDPTVAAGLYRARL
jgi:hypothetical protein